MLDKGRGMVVMGKGGWGNCGGDVDFKEGSGGMAIDPSITVSYKEN